MSAKRYLIIFIMAAAMTVQSTAQTRQLEDNVQSLLSRMTLEEKVGQMTQISLEYISKGYPATADPLELDMDRVKKMIHEYHVGSFLNVGTHSHSVKKWEQIIKALQDEAVKKTRLGIPIIYGIDGIHGASYVKDATLFPQGISIAASFNPELVRKSAEITAIEIRAAGLPWNFNPVLGMGRNPVWPRLWETFGEDPYLVTKMGEAYIEGQEGKDISAYNRVAACMKHYLGYSFPLTGQDRTPAWIPERQLRELFVPPFKAAALAGVHTVMVNSCEINGVPVHASRFYLHDLLIEELGFKGFVVSDWLDIKNLYIRSKVASSEKEATRMAVMAGVDMSMVPTDTTFTRYLIELVNEGQIPMSRIDEAVGRILRVKYELGLFENPYASKEAQKHFASDEHVAANLQAARESISMVKNDAHTLPLANGSRILVTGPNADRLSVLNGGWTITWQGNREELYPQEKMTVREALEAAMGAEHVKYVPGTTFDKVIDIEAAASAASNVDAIVAVLGEETYCETPGNIKDLTLPEAQLELVHRLAATGKPVVLVMLEGRPRIIREIVDESKAVLVAFLPGMEGSRAIADVLTGRFNPGGRLPVTYPRYPNDLTLYDHKNSAAHDGKSYDPQWGFGHGLSYTTFEYSDLKLNKARFGLYEAVDVTVSVRNTGKVAGHESVLLYVKDHIASITPANRRLKGFEKVFLKPGESREVTFRLEPEDLSFIGIDNKSVVESGMFSVFVGKLEQEFELK